jgi:chromosome segregation protein
MMLKKLELHGFKSFAKKTELSFGAPIAAVVGPNGSGKSNVVESIRFVLGEQSIKSLRSTSGKDLIFAGSKQVPKMSRASVSITFDNQKRIFQLTNTKSETLNIDFDEITLTREVFPDGSNVYKINGVEVRMKDIHELIASVNIGSSGHHIISQGEADRLLNANARERKEMVEDALGLKLYHYRIKDAEKKLSKTEENLKETESLRREVAPHLKFLKRQVDKIEKAKEMREKLFMMYRAYFKKEALLLDREQSVYSQEKKGLEQQLSTLDAERSAMKQELDIQGKTKEEEELEVFEKQLHDLRARKEEIARNLGKLEGMIEIAQDTTPPEKEQREILVKFEDVKNLVTDIDVQITRVLDIDDFDNVRNSLKTIRGTLQEFVASQEEGGGEEAAPTVDREKIAQLKKTYQEVQQQLAEIEDREAKMQGEVSVLRNRIADEKRGAQQKEREYFELTTKRSELQSQLNMLNMKFESTQKSLQDFEEERSEAKVLVGEVVLDYKNEEVDENDLDRSRQEIARREIERIKIKLEDMGGGGGSDVIKEYEETLEREEFLNKEIEDLQGSMHSLLSIIADLKDQLEKEFLSGVHQINDQFEEFFKLMFGGGKAALRVVEVQKRKKKVTDAEGNLLDLDDEEEDAEKGIEIRVNIPRKKITALEMLSGGERSLTSIALLFALSQVNPPPFLVLDETDAALDEANSRRYGDMLENLSKLSQLIVVTHNRETMSRASMLYGVTIGSEGCSKLLSVKFEDAQAFAK